jgi:hypothetical protein
MVQAAFASWCVEYILVTPMERLEQAGRWLAVGVLAVLTWRFARLPLDGTVFDTFLHLPNLVFHEAGHIIFSPFGRTLTVLGGSLFQILVPLICAGAFLYQQHDRFGAAVCTWWAGQNFVDVAPYIADARRLQLPLLGGGTGAEIEGHDWEYLLAQAGWLHLDVGLGRAALVAGVAVMLASLAWAFLLVLTAQTGERAESEYR